MSFKKFFERKDNVNGPVNDDDVTSFLIRAVKTVKFNKICMNPSR